MEYIPTMPFDAQAAVNQVQQSRNILNANSRSNQTSGHRMLNLPMNNIESSATI